MASIAEWIQKIKTAIYGEEVRGAIWQSLQAMNDELTSADVTQIPVNKADIANLRTDVTAVQGSVTSLQGDVETAGAEVEDIRVGADGTVYNNAGDAVRGQVSDLKSALSEYIYTDPNVNHVDTSKYINAICEPHTGAEVATDSYRLTDYIEVTLNDDVYFSYINANGNVSTNGALICNRLYKFDTNKNYLGFDDNVTNPYVVPANVGYIRFIISAVNPYNTAMLFINPTIFPPTAYVPYSSGEVVDIAKASTLENVDGRLTDVETEINGTVPTIINGAYSVQHDNTGYISTIGNIVSNNSYFYSNSILFRKGDVISIASSDSSGKNISRLSEWTFDNKYVRTLAYGSTTFNTVSVTLDHDSYIRFCGMSARDFDVNVNGINIPNVLERSIKAEVSQIKNPMFWSYNIWKVLCIGDSLTSGATYAEEWGELAPVGSSIDQNYPRILGRMLNADVTNAGFSGYSASNWYTDKLSNYTLVNYDTFIIWLGTNNGLTPDSLDTDESEANYYCKIIDAIKSANSSCLIVLCKVFASGGSVIYTNQAIEAIAERYNLPVINNDDLSDTLHPELHAGVNNPHFGKSGNVFVAHRIAEEIGKYIEINPLRGEFGYTPRTN